ncbi:hypothetical protein ACWD1W_39770 [Streptomyces olivaceoviridis]
MFDQAVSWVVGWFRAVVGRPPVSRLRDDTVAALRLAADLSFGITEQGPYQVHHLDARRTGGYRVASSESVVSPLAG